MSLLEALVPRCRRPVGEYSGRFTRQDAHVAPVLVGGRPQGAAEATPAEAISPAPNNVASKGGHGTPAGNRPLRGSEKKALLRRRRARTASCLACCAQQPPTKDTRVAHTRRSLERPASDQHRASNLSRTVDPLRRSPQRQLGLNPIHESRPRQRRTRRRSLRRPCRLRADAQPSNAGQGTTTPPCQLAVLRRPLELGYDASPSLRPQSSGGGRSIRATLFNDAGCPWGYSGEPQPFACSKWRYGDQIEWRLVVIGLRDEVSANRCSSSSIRPGSRA